MMALSIIIKSNGIKKKVSTYDGFQHNNKIKRNKKTYRRMMAWSIIIKSNGIIYGKSDFKYNYDIYIYIFI